MHSYCGALSAEVQAGEEREAVIVVVCLAPPATVVLAAASMHVHVPLIR
jgi:hypothetical protein